MVSNNTENYIRLLLLHAVGATPVLRETIENFVKNSSSMTLGKLLKSLESLLKTLKRKGILIKSQYDKLLTRNLNVDVNEWDSSLLCLVLLNCCTIDGKMHELKNMLLKETNNDLNTFVKVNSSIIDKYKGKGISEEQYDIMYPVNGLPTDKDLWNMELIVFVVINVCTGLVQDGVRELKRILQIELELKSSNFNLTDFLRCHEKKLHKVKGQGKLSQSQYEQLFPPNGVFSDVNKWDNNVLCVVVLQCSSSLNLRSIVAINRIRTVRNECLAHKHTAEMKNTEFQSNCSILKDSIKTIITEESLTKPVNINTVIEDIMDEPIEMKSAISTLKDFYIKNSSENLVILNNLDTVETLLRTIERKMDDGFKDLLKLMNEMNRKIPDTSYTEVSEIKCIDMILVVKSETEKGRLKAESMIESAMKQASDNNTEDTKEAQMQAAISVIREVINDDDRTTVEVKKGSIILKIKCNSLKSLHGLFKYIASVDIKYHLKVLSLITGEIVGELVDINAHVSEFSLFSAYEDVIRIISEFLANTSILPFPIRVSTIQDLQNAVEKFQGTDIKSKFRSLSEQLTLLIGERISVDVVVPPVHIISERMRVQIPETDIYERLKSTKQKVSLGKQSLRGSSCSSDEDSPKERRLPKTPSYDRDISTYVYQGDIATTTQRDAKRIPLLSDDSDISDELYTSQEKKEIERSGTSTRLFPLSYPWERYSNRMLISLHQRPTLGNDSPPWYSPPRYRSLSSFPSYDSAIDDVHTELQSEKNDIILQKEDDRSGSDSSGYCEVVFHQPYDKEKQGWLGRVKSFGKRLFSSKVKQKRFRRRKLIPAFTELSDTTSHNVKQKRTLFRRRELVPAMTEFTAETPHTDEKNMSSFSRTIDTSVSSGESSEAVFSEKIPQTDDKKSSLFSMPEYTLDLSDSSDKQRRDLYFEKTQHTDKKKSPLYSTTSHSTSVLNWGSRDALF